MKNIVLLIAILLICAGVIYSQQNRHVEPVAIEATTLEHQGSTGDNIDSSTADTTNETTGALTSAAAKDAEVSIISPQDGSVVSSPVVVEFGIKNMTISPAGIDVPYAGHHHLLIDTDTLPDMTAPLPASDTLIHFGGGQTETSIELAPGTHTLQLVLGNHLHVPHDPPVISEKITITVAE